MNMPPARRRPIGQRAAGTPRLSIPYFPAASWAVTVESACLIASSMVRRDRACACRSTPLILEKASLPLCASSAHICWIDVRRDRGWLENAGLWMTQEYIDGPRVGPRHRFTTIRSKNQVCYIDSLGPSSLLLSAAVLPEFTSSPVRTISIFTQASSAAIAPKAASTGATSVTTPPTATPAVSG